MLKFSPDIDKPYILEHVSEEEIFKRYLGIDVSMRGKFASPLREDKIPTCNFFRHRSSGEIYLKDHSGHFAGNCFDTVMFIYTVTYGKALEIIASDFGLIEGDVDRKPMAIVHRERVKSKIEFVSRPWMKCDADFWEPYGIKAPLLAYYKVSPIKHLFLDGNIHYSHYATNPAYHYDFGKGDDKVYFPKKKSFRFLCNTATLQGYDQLPKTGKILIITKSHKDIMVLYNLGYPAVAPQSESMPITPEDYKELSARFDTIYSWYDFDMTGIRTANKMKKEYGIEPIFLTNGRFKSRDFGAKDVSDWFKTVLRRATTPDCIKSDVEILRRFFISFRDEQKNKDVPSNTVAQHAPSESIDDIPEESVSALKTHHERMRNSGGVREEGQGSEDDCPF